MNDLTKMNLIAIVQQLPKEYIDFIQTCITFLEKEIEYINKSGIDEYDPEEYRSYDVDIQWFDDSLNILNKGSDK